MGNVSKAHLTNKDIKNLQPKSTKYPKAVGDPKQLYIMVHPSGKKTFMYKYDDNHYRAIGEFVERIYGVDEARKKANEMLKDQISGKDIATMGKSDKYKFANLFDRYIKQQIKKRQCREHYKKEKGTI